MDTESKADTAIDRTNVAMSLFIALIGGLAMKGVFSVSEISGVLHGVRTGIEKGGSPHALAFLDEIIDATTKDLGGLPGIMRLRSETDGSA